MQNVLCSWSKARALVALYKDGYMVNNKGMREGADIIFLKYDSSIFRQSSNPVCGFSTMEQVRLCDVWPADNWLGSSMNHIQG